MARKVLVVDDNPIVRWTLKIALQTANYDVTVVARAGQVRTALAAERFDLILMDIDMPGLDGLSAAEQVMAGGWAPEARILFLTSSDDIADMTRARRLGAFGFLTKDSGCGEIVAKIDSFLNSPATTWMDDHTRLVARRSERSANAVGPETSARRYAGGRG